MAIEQENFDSISLTISINTATNRARIVDSRLSREKVINFPLGRVRMVWRYGSQSVTVDSMEWACSHKDFDEYHLMTQIGEDLKSHRESNDGYMRCIE